MSLGRPSILMLLSNYRGIGGHEVVVNNLCLGLKRLGYDIVIGAFKFSGAPPRGIPQLSLSKFTTIKDLDRLPFDIIHNHQTIMNYYSMFTSKPFIFHYHGAANKVQMMNLRLSSILCRNKISKIISVSHAGLNILSSPCAIVIYNGVDTELFNTRPSSIPKKGYPQLLFVGILYNTKNVQWLINAMSKVLTLFPNAFLQVVGDGDAASMLSSMIDKLHLEKHVELLGKIDNAELSSIYSSCDFYVSASRLEALPLPPFEAMACGKPLLLSNIPAHKEIIDNSGAGLLFSLDGANFIEQLAKLNSNKTHFQINARKFAELNNWDIVCKKVAAIYESLL